MPNGSTCAGVVLHAGQKVWFLMQNNAYDFRYSVPSHPISIPRSSTTDDLRNVLRELLKDQADSASFDFLLHNEFIEGTLDEFLSKKQVALVGLGVPSNNSTGSS